MTIPDRSLTSVDDARRARRLSIGAGETWAFGGALAYALTNIFSRIAVVDPIAAPAFRLIPTLAISWTQVGRSRARWATLSPSAPDFVGWRAISVLFMGGALGSTIGTVAFFSALQAGGVVLTAPVLATNILWSAVIAAVFLKERLSARMVAGIFVAMLGVALLGLGRAGSSGSTQAQLTAIPLALITTLSWSASANCSRYALTRGVDKYLAIALSQTFGIALLISILFVLGRGALLWTTPMSAVGVLLLAGLLSAAAIICDAHALSLTTVASALTISLGTNPILSTILAVLFLHEELRPLMAIGTLLTLAGVVYVQWVKERN